MMEYHAVHSAIRDATAPLVEETNQLRRELKRSVVRINQLELFVEALLNVGETKKLFSAAEWQVMVARVDLMDGLEDGKRNPLEYRGAPVCHHCQRYVNPQRATCVYCHTALVNAQVHEQGPYRGSAPKASEPKPEPKRVACTSCTTVVPQTDVYFSSSGELVCGDCFQT